MSHAGHLGLDYETKLQAVMASATGTTQPQAHVSFYDVPTGKKDGLEEYRIQLQRTTLNDTTAVDICDAPLTAGTVRIVTSVSIVNRSTDTEIISISTDVGGASRRIITKTLTTLQGLYYEQGRGWYTEGG